MVLKLLQYYNSYEKFTVTKTYLRTNEFNYNENYTDYSRTHITPSRHQFNFVRTRKHFPFRVMYCKKHGVYLEFRDPGFCAPHRPNLI